MKTILVTGCNGVFGRYVTKSLLAAGYRVLGLSIEPKPFLEDKDFGYRSVDITDAHTVEQELIWEPVDVLIHLAALVHVRDSRLSFVDYSRVNYVASKRLFELASARGIRRIVFASTIEVYGPIQIEKRVSETAPCNPESDYARTKLLAEAALVEVAGRSKTMDYAILRLAPVYAADFRLNLDKRLYLRPRIGYYLGRGKYRLALCSVHNIEHFITQWVGQEVCTSGIFNVCDEESYPIHELLAREALKGRASITLPIPYELCLMAVAVLQTALNLARRSSGMFTVDNIRKLVRNVELDTDRARAAVGPLPWNIDRTMGDGG